MREANFDFVTAVFGDLASINKFMSLVYIIQWNL